MRGKAWWDPIVAFNANQNGSYETSTSMEVAESTGSGPL